jgi:hypothetical protein
MYSVEIVQDDIIEDYKINILYGIDCETEDILENEFDYEIHFYLSEDKKVKLIDKINKFINSRYDIFNVIIEYIENKYLNFSLKNSIRVKLDYDESNQIDYLQIDLFKQSKNDLNQVIGIEILSFCTIFSNGLDYCLDDDFSFDWSHNSEDFIDEDSLNYVNFETICKHIDLFLLSNN